MDMSFAFLNFQVTVRVCRVVKGNSLSPICCGALQCSISLDILWAAGWHGQEQSQIKSTRRARFETLELDGREAWMFFSLTVAAGRKGFGAREVKHFEATWTRRHKRRRPVPSVRWSISKFSAWGCRTPSTKWKESSCSRIHRKQGSSTTEDSPREAEAKTSKGLAGEGCQRVDDISLATKQLSSPSAALYPSSPLTTTAHVSESSYRLVRPYNFPFLTFTLTSV